ncbi:hypothetical protein BDP27DRAFT_1378632, partial [Rhodocollybia butyracea]
NVKHTGLYIDYQRFCWSWLFQRFYQLNFTGTKKNVDILGSVKVITSGTFFQFPIRPSNMKYLHRTTSTAVVSAVVGYLDSMVAAKQAAARFGYSISPNRELVALGASNIGASLIPGTLPAFGSIGRRSYTDGILSVLRVSYCNIFPATMALLSAKMCPGIDNYTVVLSLLQETPHDLIYYWKMGAWMDLLLVTLTFVLSIVWNIEVGIVVSLIISLLLVVHRSSKTRMSILGRIPGTDSWKPINENPEAEEDVSGALIIQIRENLDFANAAQLKERLRRLELYGVDKSHPSEDPRRTQATVLVFHMADMDHCDASACQIFYELIEEYRSRGVEIFITHLRAETLKVFERRGLLNCWVRMHSTRTLPTLWRKYDLILGKCGNGLISTHILHTANQPPNLRAVIHKFDIHENNPAPIFDTRPIRPMSLRNRSHSPKHSQPGCFLDGIANDDTDLYIQCKRIPGLESSSEDQWRKRRQPLFASHISVSTTFGTTVADSLKRRKHKVQWYIRLKERKL